MNTSKLWKIFYVLVQSLIQMEIAAAKQSEEDWDFEGQLWRNKKRFLSHKDVRLETNTKSMHTMLFPFNYVLM